MGEDTMFSSARNQFLGTITQIIEGAVNAEVILNLSGNVQIAALVTIDSIHTLDLSVGKQAYALVKASQVILLNDLNLKVTARNNLAGVVKSILHGAVNTEIALELDGGQLLKALITKEALEEMNIQLGQNLKGVFKANSVLLAVF
jgi:molybdate transport system regulatory protein